ncbi:MAG: hypothetical protein EOM67_15555 [Spirochaetia bacterium]|nr:hypothetical protein [Spirochaetia bacterium]
MTREEFIKKYKNDWLYYFDGYYSACIDDFLTNIYNDHEAQLKAKDEEIERLEEIINTSIEEIEYVIIKPHYVEVYLNNNNAIRFLKDNK